MKNSQFPLTHFLIALTLTLSLVFLSQQHRLGLLELAVNFIFTPLRYPFVQVNQFTSRQISHLRQIPNQQRLIKDLQRQNTVLSLSAHKVIELEKENQALRNITKTPLITHHSLVPAQVIGLTRFALLNQGETSAVKSGLAVVTDQGIIIGVVDTVSAHTAKVRLLTDPSLDLNGVTNQNTAGQVKTNQNRLELTQVLQKDLLSVDDRVFTKGSEYIPGGILLGVISAVSDNPASVYQSAVIRPSATISDQQIVFIVLE